MLNKIKTSSVVLSLVFFVLPVWAMQAAFGSKAFVPRVAYIEPANDALVDLRGKKELLFRWQEVPIPAGGREEYRFLLNKEPGYNTVFKATVDSREFSITVPANKFEDGARYSWYVKQRDGRTMAWSRYDIWYFTVKR